MDSQQYVLKSCTVAKRVFYTGTRTLFFCTAGPIPETFSFIVNLLFKLCFSHLKKICLWHNLPQIHAKLYICFPIKKLQLKKIKVLVATFLKTEKEQVKLILIMYCV